MSPELLAHDLRAPLARAKTYGKLLAEVAALPEEGRELLALLQAALDDLDREIASIGAPDEGDK